MAQEPSSLPQPLQPSDTSAAKTTPPLQKLPFKVADLDRRSPDHASMAQRAPRDGCRCCHHLTLPTPQPQHHAVAGDPPATAGRLLQRLHAANRGGAKLCPRAAPCRTRRPAQTSASSRRSQIKRQSRRRASLLDRHRPGVGASWARCLLGSTPCPGDPRRSLRPRSP
jgi:hypothetical protein